MVCFVEYAASSKVFEFEFKLLAGDVLSADDHSHFPLHDLIESRKRKASLVSDLFAFNVNYLRVDKDMLLRRPVFAWDVHHKETLGNADLRRGKPHSASVVHRREHPLDHGCEIRVKVVFV